MPIFQPRNRIQILRDMIARTVARSDLVGLTRNSVVFHVLASAANEDAEQYFQMARLRELFSIDKATGSDLDDRAREVLPGTISRRLALYASGTVVFSRPGIIGTVVIASGTIVAASDVDGQIRFRTTAPVSITPGNTDAVPVALTALVAGGRGNVDAAQIIQFITRISGVTGVSNGAKLTGGSDRESDVAFRARIKNWVQAISRGTPTALETYARNVILSTGQRVVYANLVEPVIPNGIVQLYIDDGTGSVETYDSVYIGAPDTFLVAAVGGEKNLFTTEKPIRDDGSFILRINAVVKTRGIDYDLNPALGQIELSPASYPAGLTAGNTASAEYRFYTGLIQETQRVMDGDPATPVLRPGVRPAGVMVEVLAPATALQSVVANLSVLSDYNVTVVTANVSSVIQEYINTLDIGAHVIASEIVERSMAVGGMYNFSFTSLTGTAPPADQVILDNQVARINSVSITLT